MAAKLTQEQLEELVVGKKERPRAEFFEKAALDVAASKAEGKRIYKPVVYVKLIQSGIVDSVAYPAQANDMREYAEEYKYFMNNRQGSTREISIDIIPSLDIIHRQELVDMGLPTIRSLAESTQVPPHLEYARLSAIALYTVIKEQQNGKGQSGSLEAIPTEERNGSGALSANDRQHNDHDVGQPIIPKSLGDRKAESVTERSEEARSVDNRQGVMKKNHPMPDWSVGFTFRL